MAGQRVFLVWRNPLFRDALLVLLQQAEVSCVGSLKHGEVTLKEILDSRPQTVLVEEIEGKVPGSLLFLFEEPSFSGRLIGFNLTNNRVHVYRREDGMTAHAEDLLSLILR